MRIVLLDDVINVGEAGEVVEVKNGYARNFLIPKGIAVRLTRDVHNRIELIKRAAETRRARRMSEAAGKFAEVAGRRLVIRMKTGTESRLFGAVTSAMIADEVVKQLGVELERRHIMLDEPIKHLGEFTVPLKASADVTGEIKLVVEPERKPGEVEKKLIAEDRVRREAEAAVVVDAEPAHVGEATVAADVQEKYEAHEEPAGADEPPTD